MTDAARFGAELWRQSRRQADAIRPYRGRGIDFNQGGKPKWKQENNRRRCAASGAASGETGRREKNEDAGYHVPGGTEALCDMG